MPRITKWFSHLKSIVHNSEKRRAASITKRYLQKTNKHCRHNVQHDKTARISITDVSYLHFDFSPMSVKAYTYPTIRLKAHTTPCVGVYALCWIFMFNLHNVWIGCTNPMFIDRPTYRPTERKKEKSFHVEIFRKTVPPISSKVYEFYISSGV